MNLLCLANNYFQRVPIEIFFTISLPLKSPALRIQANVTRQPHLLEKYVLSFCSHPRACLLAIYMKDLGQKQGDKIGMRYRSVTANFQTGHSISLS
jgi:hypothetical protein